MDTLGKIPRLGKGTMKLLNNNNVLTVEQFKNLNKNNLPKIHGISQLWNKATNAIEEECPYIIIIHRQHDNPYLLRFEEGWLLKLKKSTAMKPFVPISYT